MSLVTRCPSCSTAFKVVRDQLRLSEGWVRCGRCGEVFDAQADLREQMPDGRWKTLAGPGGPAPGAAQMASPSPSPLPAMLPDAAALSLPGQETPAPPIAQEGTAAHDGWEPTHAQDATPPDGEDEVAGGAQETHPAAAPPAWPSVEWLDLPASGATPGRPSSAASSAPTLDVTPTAEDAPPPLGPSAAAPAPAPTSPPSRVLPAPAEAQISRVLRRGRPSAAGESTTLASFLRPGRGASGRAVPPARAQRPEPVEPGWSADDAPPSLGAHLHTDAAEPSGARDVADSHVPARTEGPATMAAQAPADAPAPPHAHVDEPAPEHADAHEPIPAMASPLRAPDAEALPIADAVAPALPRPSFLDTPDAATAPRAQSSRTARVLWAAAALLLGALLAAQAMRHERNHWAAERPALRPVLEALCRATACTLEAPRRIDDIRVDGSTLMRDGADGRYRLVFTLRNASTQAVAMPAIELSLLDGSERPVVRRVILPAQMGRSATLAGRTEAELALALQLSPAPGRALPAVVGHSVLAFYP
ncbi:DUF3426 domain-containing protein [uncultured Pseudacidovorax sp.]|uniref:DUF3426 domain-containing protein n=1 Tax=uncultured Pseudacidovorax sp. TaxID=679313 RepID=UPI0025E9B7F7|nr:DUF3426 domain-containing protein [uncultured Pseudacidovorax sp.]